MAVWNPIICQTALTFNCVEKTADDIAALLADKRRVGHGAFVAETAGTVVGVGHYGQFRSGPGYARTMEHTVMLARDARGRGLGRDLMAAIESHARHGGARQMFAGVSGENPAGREFHLALGYRLVATLPEVGWKFGRWMDLWLLAKRL